MTPFIAAYLIVWAVVGLYVVRLHNAQRQISRRLHTLEDLLAKRNAETGRSRAA